jgi:hypothetical protein
MENSLTLNLPPTANSHSVELAGRFNAALDLGGLRA